MTNAPTIYGYPSAEWNLPEEYAHCREAVLAWRDWGEIGFESLSAIAIALQRGDLLGVDITVKRSLSYEADTEQADRWQHPESLLCGPSIKYLHGDCEDFALCFAGLAHRALGIDLADIFVTVLHLPNEISGYAAVNFEDGDAIESTEPVIHAVCVIRTEEGNKVLDHRAIEVMNDAPDADIVPLFSISLDGEAFLHGRDEMTPFEQIKAGLEDAKAYGAGDKTKGRVVLAAYEALNKDKSDG